MIRAGLIMMIIGMMGCGPSAAQRDFLYPIEVDQQKTQLVGNTCEIHFSVTNLSSGQEYSLIWLQVVLKDAEDKVFTQIFDAQELKEIVESFQLPPAAKTQGDFVVDLTPGDLGTSPFVGTIQMVGVGFQQTVHFLGPLTCE